MGQRIGDHPVDDGLAVQAPPAGPRASGSNTPRCASRTHSADPLRGTDSQRVGSEQVERVRTQALEADLDYVPGVLLGLQQAFEVRQRSDRRLLEQDIGAGRERGLGEHEVNTERRGDDHDVDGTDGGQGLR